jgi:hypothetical protein
LHPLVQSGAIVVARTSDIMLRGRGVFMAFDRDALAAEVDFNIENSMKSVDAEMR